MLILVDSTRIIRYIFMACKLCSLTSWEPERLLIVLVCAGIGTLVFRDTSGNVTAGYGNHFSFRSPWLSA